MRQSFLINIVVEIFKITDHTHVLLSTEVPARAEAGGEPEPRTQLGICLVGQKTHVAAARIALEDEGLRNGLSVTVDRHVPTGFADHLNAPDSAHVDL